MRKQLLFFLSISLLLACNNDKKSSAPEITKNSGNPSATTGDNRIVFSVDNRIVETSGWNIAYFNLGIDSLKHINITSNMNEQKETVIFNINGDQPGTYNIVSGLDAIRKPGIAYGSYRPDYKNDMANTYSFESGELIIQSIDPTAHTLNASFHSVAKNRKGETVNITDGKVINGKMKL